MSTTAEEFDALSNELVTHVTELNRIDTAVVAAARVGIPLPSAAEIFDVLSDASIATADVLESYVATPLPAEVRYSLLQLQCSMTDVAASIRLYTTLMVRPQ
jgi:hypothetical protein